MSAFSADFSEFEKKYKFALDGFGRSSTKATVVLFYVTVPLCAVPFSFGPSDPLFRMPFEENVNCLFKPWHDREEVRELNEKSFRIWQHENT